MWRRVAGSAGLVVVLVASCGDPGSSSPEPGVSSSMESAAGFDGLDVVVVQDTGVSDPADGTVLTAQDTAELGDLWAEAGSRHPAPAVDFDEQVVVAYVIHGNGCRDLAVTVSVDHEERTATTVFAHALPVEMCRDILQIRYHVLAVDLADLCDGPVNFESVVDRSGDLARSQPSAVPVEPPDEAAVEVDEPDGIVPRPEPGQAISATLDDGLPVWVVGHDDGSVTVLDAIAPPDWDDDLNAPEPVRRFANWYPDAQRFSGPSVYDAWGRSLLAPRTEDLVRRAADIDGEQVRVGGPIATAPGRPVGGPLPDDIPTEPEHLELGDPVPLDEAMAAEKSPVMVSDPIVVATRDGRSVGRICPVETPPARPKPCPDTAPVVFDIQVPADWNEIRVRYGDSLVKIDNSDVTLLAQRHSGSSARAW